MLSKTNDVTIITNGLENGLLLSQFANCNSYIAGGVIQPKAASSIGTDTNSFVNGFNCDAFFFSCHGLTIESGPTEGTIEQQRSKESMVKNSKKQILLADHTKFGKTFVASVCPLSGLDVIITDIMPDASFVKAFKDNNIELIVANK
jgi:DeoR/GlpR family transcriptional regulator of sugar metabolism